MEIVKNSSLVKCQCTFTVHRLKLDPHRAAVGQCWSMVTFENRSQTQYQVSPWAALAAAVTTAANVDAAIQCGRTLRVHGINE